jgi:thiol:disulfide interchange protein
MKKHLLAMALVTVLMAAGIASATVPADARPEATRAASYAEALTLSALTGKPVIVDFYAVW